MTPPITGVSELDLGINSGPVVAGVIGTATFAYDLWGDAVNTARRVESHGVPGAIQVTAATDERLHDQYLFEAREMVDVKGKGTLPHTCCWVGDCVRRERKL